MHVTIEWCMRSVLKKSMNFVLNRRLYNNLLTGIIPDAFCGDSARNYNNLYVKSFHIVSFWLTICTKNNINDYSAMHCMDYILISMDDNWHFEGYYVCSFFKINYFAIVFFCIYFFGRYFSGNALACSCDYSAVGYAKNDYNSEHLCGEKICWEGIEELKGEEIEE